MVAEKISRITGEIGNLNRERLGSSKLHGNAMRTVGFDETEGSHICITDGECEAHRDDEPRDLVKKGRR